MHKQYQDDVPQRMQDIPNKKCIPPKANSVSNFYAKISSWLSMSCNLEHLKLLFVFEGGATEN